MGFQRARSEGEQTMSGSTQKLASTASVLCILAGAAIIAPTAAAANSFVYTNNDRVPNSISAFAVAADGSLTAIPGSPFPTGGDGGQSSLFGSNRVTAATAKNILYAANAGSNTVAAFSVDTVSGALTPVPGSPFATGGLGGPGISLAITPDDKYLAAANSESSNITVYAIAANGSLSPVAGSPFAAGGKPDGIRVTPDGKFLAVAISFTNVAMFNILPTGGLTPITGSPFASAGAAGVDCNCASTRLFVGEATSGTKVDVYSIDNGSLSAIPGSPFSGAGVNSNVALLSPDDTKLFVSNQFGKTVTSFTVAANGSLSLVPGSPFPTGSETPSGMATTQDGAFLYLANFHNQISGFSIAGSGALAPVPGSPYSNGFSGDIGLLSLAVFPAKKCCPAPAINGGSASPSVLLPANNKMVDITLDYSVTGPCSNSCVLTVASNQPVNGTGDGNTSPDWQVIDSRHLLLRAERTGNTGDRVYTITITCTNQLNNVSSTKTVTVTVPHDNGQ
jgi:6-phosphogluconolactonase (cycloisomerase 2 family)